MGVFEKQLFSHGTKNLLHSVADLTKKGTMTVIGMQRKPFLCDCLLQES